MSNHNPTQVANLMTQRWRPGFQTAANEERVVTYRFLDASDGAKSIENRLFFRKVGTFTGVGQLPATGGAGVYSGISYPVISDSYGYIDPTFDYGGVEIPLNTLSRIDDESGLQAAYKKQMLAALSTQFDVRGAQLATGLATNVKGSGAVNLEKGLLFDAWNALLVSGKEQVQAGKTRIHLVLWAKQAKHLMNITEFTYSYLRGDGKSPIVRGWVSEVMNMTIEESSNIYAAAGVAHNLMFLPDAFCYAYNMKAHLLDPQFDEFLVRILCAQESGFAEQWDEYAVDMQTSMA